jgi:hypothetical protein
LGHARKEHVVLIGTDQRITSGPAARTAVLFRGRIHDCTRIVSRKVRFFSLAPRAPSIHDPSLSWQPSHHNSWRPGATFYTRAVLPSRSRPQPFCGSRRRTKRGRPRLGGLNRFAR